MKKDLPTHFGKSNHKFLCIWQLLRGPENSKRLEELKGVLLVLYIINIVRNNVEYFWQGGSNLSKDIQNKFIVSERDYIKRALT